MSSLQRSRMKKLRKCTYLCPSILTQLCLMQMLVKLWMGYTYIVKLYICFDLCINHSGDFVLYYNKKKIDYVAMLCHVI